MLLENQTAIVYGGAGPIGSAVARAFAREGARVFLAGRSLRTLDDVAQVTGRIDIAFNATSNDDIQGTPWST